MVRLPHRTAERLAREEPVVVMGRGHSGTRVLSWALEELGVRLGTLAEKTTGDLQDRRFTRTIKKIAARELERPPLAEPRPADVRRLRRGAFKLLRWMERNAAGWPDRVAWGWKFPETYLVGNVVDAVFPRARYVHMVRDGRDLAFKAHLTDDADRGLGRRLLRHLGALHEPRHLQAARSWDFQVRRFTEFESRLGDRVHRLTFEELILDPEASTKRLCSFLGIGFTDACRRFLAESLRRGKVSQHREEDPARVAEVEALIGPTLEAWGYEREGA
jgi:hypothetical protein